MVACSSIIQISNVEMLSRLVHCAAAGGVLCNMQTMLKMSRHIGQADKSRVKDYIHRLDNFDGPAVGEIAVGYEMFEEAFEIYKKFSLKTQAIKVLLDQMDDLPRALEYANKVRRTPMGVASAECMHMCLIGAEQDQASCW